MGPWKLTERQAQVMDLIVAGECNQTIAARLGLGMKTIEAHASGARKAMSATRAQAAVLWDRWRHSRGGAQAAEARYAWTKKGMVPNQFGAWAFAPDGAMGSSNDQPKGGA